MDRAARVPKCHRMIQVGNGWDYAIEDCEAPGSITFMELHHSAPDEKSSLGETMRLSMKSNTWHSAYLASFPTFV